MNTPQDIYEYVIRSGKEAAFLSAVMMQKENYSIAEIPDAVFAQEEDGAFLKSEAFHLHTPVRDAEILAAVKQGLYVSAFLSRHEDAYRLHFLVHPCRDKTECEEAVTRAVVRYLILQTIVALRLTTWRKVDEYVEI